MGQTEERDEIVTVLPNAMRSTSFQKSGHAQIHTWPSGGLLLAQGRNQQNPASPAPPRRAAIHLSTKHVQQIVNRIVGFTVTVVVGTRDSVVPMRKYGTF